MMRLYHLASTCWKVLKPSLYHKSLHTWMTEYVNGHKTLLSNHIENYVVILGVPLTFIFTLLYHIKYSHMNLQ